MDSLTSWRIPGNTISVCLEGKEVFNYQSGFADVENKIPMNKDHLFFIYSCSKVTTVTETLQLYEKGVFLLDDPDLKLSMFYAHHMLSPQESYYQPRLRNVLYASITR